LKKFDNLILDLGGVILRIDYNLARLAFEKLGVENFHQLFSKASQTDLFDLLEKGLISDELFFSRLREISRISLSDEQITQAWNSMLIDLPPERLQLLRNLEKNYRLFLLSNTNSIHIQAFTAYLHSQFGNNPFEDIFERLYYSSEINMRKPDSEIFRKVMDDNNLNPSRTLFIDDSPQHVEGALKTGLMAYHLKDDESITDVFDESGFNFLR
jgi:glucose-1-phosphatase